MLHGLTQVQQLEYPDKIFQTAMEWSEVLQQYVTEQGKSEGFESCD